MRAVELAERIPSAKRRGKSGWWDALCPNPAHKDTRPSFSFRDNEEKCRVDLYCRKRCTCDEISTGLGLRLADLFFDAGDRSPSLGPPGRVIAEYSYHNEAGHLAYVVERREPKTFRQKRPDGTGGWIWNLAGVPRVLYRLPELQRQARVHVVEGERDVDRLRTFGLVATCNPMGAGKWTDAFTAQLVAAGTREVVIFEDNDTAGVDHARMVARSCLTAGLTVKMPRLPGLPPVRDRHGEDISDWLDAGHSLDELRELAEQTPPVTLETLTALDDLGRVPRGACAPPGMVWSLAKSAEALIAAGGPGVDWLDFPFAARGSITEINAPRGTGKTAVVLARMVALARRGLRILYVDRDNSPSTLRKRLVGLGATAVPTLKVLTREEAPSFADAAAWRAFPLSDFDVVVIDSWDTFAEGAGEQDSRRSTLALAPVLDMVRREHAPAVILLCNVTKDGKAGRGAGPLEDRADNVFEARDATGFVPTGKRKWWEDLPPAARSEWAARATRRSGQDRPERIRLAFIASKFRDDDDPIPFVLELDFVGEPWALHDVTAELVAAGDASQAAELAQAEAAYARAAEALVTDLGRRPTATPLLVKSAEAFLMAHDLKRRTARELLKSGGDGRWRLEALDRRSVAVVLCSPVISRDTAAESSAGEGPPLERVSALPNWADRMDTGRPNSEPPGSSVHAAPETRAIRPGIAEHDGDSSLTAPSVSSLRRKPGGMLATMTEEGVV